MPTATLSEPLRTAWGCGAIALIACLAVIYATPNDGYWTVDCGSKALQAKRLLATGFGSLNLDYPAARYDPDGAAFPIPAPYAQPRDGGFASQYPPAYPALAVPFLAMLGEAGLRVPAALGVAACALLFVLWVDSAVGRGWAAAGAGALALASPLWFYGVVVWEHSLTVALSLAAWTVLARISPPRLVAAGAMIGIACWLRAELAVMGLALAAACFFQRRRPGDVVWLGLGAAPVIAAWLIFNGIAFGHPLGLHFSSNVGMRADTAAAGVWGLVRRAAALLGGVGASGFESAGLALGAIASWGVGVACERRGRSAPLALTFALGVGLSASIFGALQIPTAANPARALIDYNGFLVRMPMIALAGIGAARVWRRPEYASLRLGVGAGLGFLAIGMILRVSLTEFQTGLFWAPRMLMPAIPALVALAVVALRGEALAGGRRRALALIGAVGLGLVGLASSGVSLWLLGQQKLEVRALQAEIVAAPQPVVVTNHPALGQQLASIWGTKPLMLVADPASLGRIGRSLGEAGVAEFLFLLRPPSGRSLGRIEGVDCALSGRHQGVQMPRIFDLDLHRCRVRSMSTPGRPSAPHS